jgi:starvation-inducible DNA-binding protein
MVKTKSHSHNGTKAAPVLNQRAKPIQKFGTTVSLPVGLSDKIRLGSINNLNQLLADTIVLRDLYKKHHWQVSGVTFYQLHLLFDKHYGEQAELVDTIAERIQSLGGVTIAVAHDVAEQTRLERPPIDREEVPVQLSRLLEAHEVILKEAHEFAKEADDSGDDGTNDLIVSDLIRLHETQVWFLSEHLVNSPVVEAD